MYLPYLSLQPQTQLNEKTAGLKLLSVEGGGGDYE